MFFMKKFREIEENEKNPVNKMYLQELLLQLKLFGKLESIEDGVEKYHTIAKAITKFVTALSNPKYRYNSETGNGFKPHSPIFSSIYLDDVVNLLLRNQPILKKKGIIFDRLAFDSDIIFNPEKLIEIDSEPMLSLVKSDEVLQIAQKIELQYRPQGRRNFKKYFITLPILIFITHRVFTKEKFSSALKIINKAKQTFKKAKMIIVCETLSNNFYPEIGDKQIDSVFILRKQYAGQPLNPIDPNLLKELENRIDFILKDIEPDYTKLVEKGVVY